MSHTLLPLGLCSTLTACSLLFAPGESVTTTEIDAGSPTETCTDLAHGITWTEQLEINFAGIGPSAGADLPVPIRFSSADFVTYKLPDTPDSLRFATADTLPLLIHEVETWSPASGALVWVLSREYPKQGENLRVLMFYGDSELASTEDAPALWSRAGYAAVYHFDDNDGGFVNSADPAEPAVLLGDFSSMAANEDDALGHTILFSGAQSSRITLPHTDHQQSNTSTDNLSIELRFQAIQPIGGEQYLIDKPDAYSIQSSVDAANSFSQGNLVLEDGTTFAVAGPFLEETKWNFLTLSVEAALNRRLNMTVNGEASGAAPSFGAPRKVSTQPLVIGRGFSGRIDELRISDKLPDGGRIAQQNAILNEHLQSFGAHSSCAP